VAAKGGYTEDIRCFGTRSNMAELGLVHIWMKARRKRSKSEKKRKNRDAWNNDKPTNNWKMSAEMMIG
jgi:hypothetical protein